MGWAEVGMHQLVTYPLQLIKKAVHSCMLTTMAVFYEHARVDRFLLTLATCLTPDSAINVLTKVRLLVDVSELMSTSMTSIGCG